MEFRSALMRSDMTFCRNGRKFCTVRAQARPV
jgi:hypothetical protein